jgi:LysM repeat protein
MTLKAIAYGAGMTDSTVASGNYTIQNNQPPAQVGAPSFNPPAGTYNSAQFATISTTTAGASIRYTTDGSTPTSAAGTVYGGPISVSSSMTLRAIAYEAGMTDSTVASANYTIQTGQLNGQVITPMFNPPAGTYGSTLLVTISTTTAGASIRYTTDGSTPTSSTGIPYSGPVSVSSSMTLKAIAYENGMTNSTVASANYIIQIIQAAAQVAMPTFNLPAGTYSSAQLVAISTTTPGALIRYTTDGSTPTSSTGIPYGGPVNVSSSMTLTAIAYESGMTDSAVNASTYAISSATTGAAWYNSMWSNRMAITIDHTKVSGPGNLINFGMLFSVSDPNLRTVANGGKVGKTDGTDIMFTASDGVSKLDHELDSYSASTGQVNAWVRLASLSATTDTVIYVYYGNVYASDQQNKTGVWDNSYRLVWHLGNGTVLSGADSTNMGNNGVAYGNAGAGKIGGGAAGMVEAVSTALPSGDETRTLECWFKITGNTGSDQAICGMGINSGQGTTFSFLYSASGSSIYLDASGATRSLPFTNDSNWHHLAAAYTRGLGVQNAAVYLDGVLTSTTGQSGTLTTLSPTYVDVHHNPANPQNDMTGVVDEFRVSNMARSAGWILTEYNNQNSPNTFFSVGGQQ